MSELPLPHREVHVQGAIEPLYVISFTSSCGDIVNGDGIAFCFGREGGWVVPLAELEAIVAEAKAYRAARAAENAASK